MESQLELQGHGLDAIPPEEAARVYLGAVLGLQDAHGLASDPSFMDESTFSLQEEERSVVTGTTVLRFRQSYKGLPVYGSRVTVELLDGNGFLSTVAVTGEPSGAPTHPRISENDAKQIILKDSGQSSGEISTDSLPRQYYYYDDINGDIWRLIYIVESVRRLDNSLGDDMSIEDSIVDYFIDSQDGRILLRLPKVHTARGVAENILDSLGRPTSFSYENGPDGFMTLIDAKFNVHTYDFQLKGFSTSLDSLPGEYVKNPPDPWLAAGVSAHVNAVTVAKFMDVVLSRQGIDGHGGPIISTVNCTKHAGTRTWRNAAWFDLKGQMLYGQTETEAGLLSMAAALDAAAHEMFHGVIAHTCRLMYRDESGALNESLADIFGVIISNWGNPLISSWNWQIAEQALDRPIRDISQPEVDGRPGHYRDYKNMTGDFGGVHTNSSIHSKVLYIAMQESTPNGDRVFSGEDIARVFYVTLRDYLGETSRFADARAGAEMASLSLFRDEDRDVRQRKLNAISKAYDAVGIDAAQG